MEGVRLFIRLIIYKAFILENNFSSHKTKHTN